MSKTSNTIDFIVKAQKVHNFTYDYTRVIYIKAIEKVEIVCLKHGSFWQTPANHLTGYGCKKCNHSSESRKFTLEQFVEKAHFIHKNKYDYKKTIYKDNHTKVTIICPVHGDFNQVPKAHLIGKGCNKCGTRVRGDKQIMKNEEFLKRAQMIHGDKYDYNETKYITKFKKIDVICKLHGKFSQQANNHLLGNGCPVCAKIIQNYYFRVKNEEASKIPCSLYIIKVWDDIESFYKVGISANIKGRFIEIKARYNIEIMLNYNTNLEEAVNMENKILKSYKILRYTPKKEFAGKTECLSDIDLAKIKEEWNIN